MGTLGPLTVPRCIDLNICHSLPAMPAPVQYRANRRRHEVSYVTLGNQNWRSLAIVEDWGAAIEAPRRRELVRDPGTLGN
jgi:hypothetical protein